MIIGFEGERFEVFLRLGIREGFAFYRLEALGNVGLGRGRGALSGKEGINGVCL